MSGPFNINTIKTKIKSIELTNKIQNGRQMELIAHRGFRNINTENTLFALKRSIQQGADTVEFDVQWSDDGVPYLFHDVTVDALTSGTGTFAALNSSVIDTLTFDSTVGTRFADMHITKVSDVIPWLQKTGCYSYPEIKTYNSLSDVYALVSLFETSGILNKTMFQSFDANVVELMLQNNANVTVGWLCGSTFAAMAAQVDRFAVFGERAALLINITSLLASPQIVSYARDRGLDVGCWTVNNQQQAEQAMAVGVYRIMSDIQLVRGL